MKDRVILGNGKSMLLKTPTLPATYAEFKASLEAGTQYADVTANNSADGVTEPGTPLSKAKLLTDATAAALGLTPADDPSVDDALGAAQGRIGDVKTTVRTDIGDDWLLCNGDTINQTTYPDLWEVAVKTAAAPTATSQKYTSNCKFYDGKFIRCNNTGYAYYATDITGTWTSITINTSYAFWDIAYDGTYYYAIGTDTNNAVPVLYKKNALTSSSWTSVSLSSVTSSAQRGTEIEYSSGQLLLRFQDTLGTTAYCYLYNISAGTFTALQSGLSSMSPIDVGFVVGTTSTSANAVFINASGTVLNLPSEIAQTITASKVGSEYVLTVKLSDGTYIYTSSDMTMFAKKGKVSSSSTYGGRVFAHGGVYSIYSGTALYYSADLVKWSQTTSEAISNEYEIPQTGYEVVLSCPTHNATSSALYYIASGTAVYTAKLPTISLTDAYAYIRAL